MSSIKVMNKGEKYAVESTSKCNITKYFCKSIQLVC